MQKHYIYKIECLVNRKVYIGQTKNKTKRIQEHKRTLKNNEHYSYHLQRAWNKYGKNNFKFSIIEECSKENVDERERYWIRHYKSNNPQYGYNQESGGSKNKEHSEESKNKMREYALKIHRWQGKNNPNYGGAMWDDERREYYRKINKAMWTPEKRKAKSEKMKEVYNLDNALETVRRKVVKLSLNGEYINTYNSVIDAARSIGKSSSAHICDCCRRNRRSALGFVWVYLDDYESGNYVVNPSALELNKRMKIVKLTMDNKYLGTYIYGDIKSKNKGKILECIKGKRKSTAGYKWIKYEDYIETLPKKS